MDDCAIIPHVVIAIIKIDILSEHKQYEKI